MMTFVVLVALILLLLALRSARAPTPAAPADGGQQADAHGEVPQSDGASDGDLKGTALSPMRAHSFELGVTYTRAEIHGAVGGGVQDYLPHAGGQVVAGCFNPDLNPDAPDVVLPGFGRDIERWAEAFAEQGSAVPCFLKRATNRWEYVGDFRVRQLSRDPGDVARWSETAGREDDVSMVLQLEEV